MSSQVSPLVQSLVTAQVAVDKTIFDSAFAIYGTVDYLGNGNNVIRFYNAGASTTERDFTATELTDGTYTTWLDGASSSATRVAKLYNQKGNSTLDLQHPSSSSRPWYESSENTVRFDQLNYFNYAVLFTTSAESTLSPFENNTTSNDTTLVLGARKKDNTLYGLPAASRTLFALRDSVSPSSPYNVPHKALAIKAGSYSDDIAISARGDDFTHVIAEHDTFDHSTLKTYIGEIKRNPVSGVTSTDMNLFVNNTQEVDTTTTSLDNDIDIGSIYLGDNRYIMKGAILFNKILTSEEKSELHTRMSQDY